MWRVMFLFIWLWPGLAAAQDFLNAEEFEAATAGKTFYFSSEGRPYGGEEYLEGRRVRWSFLDGRCIDGHWWQEGELICFSYEDDPSAHCWTFRQEANGLVALFQNESTGRLLYEVQQSDTPLQCLGPKVGV
jgi:hypothetical protein